MWNRTIFGRQLDANFWTPFGRSFWTPIFDTCLLELINGKWKFIFISSKNNFNLGAIWGAQNGILISANCVWNHQVCTIWIRSDSTQQQQLLLHGNNCQFDCISISKKHFLSLKWNVFNLKFKQWGMCKYLWLRTKNVFWWNIIQYIEFCYKISRI